MNKKVLLIYPKTGVDALKPRMPSSLLYLATSLKAHGYKPVIVDTRVEKDFLKKIRQNLDSIMVGLTTMTGMQILYALRLAKFVRKHNPDIPIVWGGVHPSLLPMQTIKHPLVDVVLRKEGDKSIVELVKALEKGKSLKNVQGLTYKQDGEITNNPDAPLLDVNEILEPDWELIDVSKYRIFDIQSARGCPHRCGFCYNIEFNKQKWRYKDAKRVVDEIENIIRKYKVDEINFIDDNFFTNRKRAEDMIDMIIERGLKFTWRTNCRANYFDNFDVEFLKKAYRAGLREIQIGCESGSQRILDYIKKDITVKQIMNSVRLCRDAGVQAQCSFMIGIPIETKKDNNKTFDLIDKLRKMDPNVLINMIAIYTPYPGAELFEKSKEFGYKPPQTLEGWGHYSYNFVNVPWLKGMKGIEYEAIAYISRFLFFRELAKKRFITPALRIPFEILSLDAWVRWKLRFFKLPFEWVLVKNFVISKTGS